jgi:uncharacterized protein YciU (UPF0263 family)
MTQQKIKFKDWFGNKLTVGAFPYKVNKMFDEKGIDVVVNVSDEWYPDVEFQLKEKFIRTYWFPMNEQKRDIGLNSIYGAMVILREAESRNSNVYLHCHAGSNRSRIVQAAYHFMRTGEQFDYPTKVSGFQNKMLASCFRGYLPPKAEMEGFLNEIANVFEKGMDGGSLDMCKINKINNF